MWGNLGHVSTQPRLLSELAYTSTFTDRFVRFEDESLLSSTAAKYDVHYVKPLRVASKYQEWFTNVLPFAQGRDGYEGKAWQTYLEGVVPGFDLQKNRRRKELTFPWASENIVVGRVDEFKRIYSLEPHVILVLDVDSHPEYRGHITRGNPTDVREFPLSRGSWTLLKELDQIAKLIKCLREYLASAPAADEENPYKHKVYLLGDTLMDTPCAVVMLHLLHLKGTLNEPALVRMQTRISYVKGALPMNCAAMPALLRQDRLMERFSLLRLRSIFEVIFTDGTHLGGWISTSLPEGLATAAPLAILDYNSFCEDSECETYVSERSFDDEKVSDVDSCCEFFYTFSCHYLQRIQDHNGCTLFYVKKGFKGVYLIAALAFYHCATHHVQEATPTKIGKEVESLIRPLLRVMADHFLSEEILRFTPSIA